MKNSYTLWIATLAGIGLTTLLVLVLHYQAMPLTRPDNIALVEKPIAVVQSQTEQSPFAQDKGTKENPGTSAAQSDSAPKPTASVVANTDSKRAAITIKTNIGESDTSLDIDLPSLPENPALPPREVEQLSPEERRKYDELIRTYQDLREQTLRLHQERLQLKQRMDKVLQESKVIDEQLNQIRDEQKSVNKP